MVETQTLEACADCVVAVKLGTGEAWRIETLMRRFGGNLLVNETSSIVTFRPCGCCGLDVAGVRYAAVAVLRTGEDA